MKYGILIIASVLTLGSTASAQEDAEVGTVSDDPTPTEAATPEKEDERGPYYKKTQGWLWMEFLVGPTAYDPDNYTALSISGSPPDLPKLHGPEYGGAIGLGLGGFWLGAFYRQAKYDVYKLMKVGLDIQGIFRFVPYVHPMVRIDLFYSKTFDGNPYGLTDPNVDGGGLTLGAGIRIPIIRWMSFSATFDWSMIGLAVRGTDPSDGTSVNDGIFGQQLGATFSLTFHFIGVRKN